MRGTHILLGSRKFKYFIQKCASHGYWLLGTDNWLCQEKDQLLTQAKSGKASVDNILHHELADASVMFMCLLSRQECGFQQPRPTQMRMKPRRDCVKTRLGVLSSPSIYNMMYHGRKRTWPSSVDTIAETNRPWLSVLRRRWFDIRLFLLYF